MPARLKSFELHGYKTFASRSEFIFADGITAIVGPNGSGKSNIADALRWVLGEQSYGLLRAKKTEDMIFAGSEHRPRAGMASATIVFDNSDGWLPIDFTDVGITRRAYRDGENEYLLNGQRVRLKDVSEVLAKSGLAERTYTVIGQGLVDAALALKAEERRRLFEEAAGIGLHRARREEALKRLETTRRNLERVQDILAELQPRLRSLERQAKRAQEFDQMKADLRVVLREWYGYHWHKGQAELVESQVTAKQNEDILTKVQSVQLDLDQKLGDYRKQINELREKLGGWHRQLAGLHQQRENLSREQAVNNERSRLFLQQQRELTSELSRVEEDIGIQREQLETADKALDQLNIEYNEALQSASEALELLNARQLERSEIEKQIQIARQELVNLTAQSSHLQARVAEKEAHIKRQKASLHDEEQEIFSAESEVSSTQSKLNSISKSIDDAKKISQAIKMDVDSIRDKLLAVEAERREKIEVATSRKALMARLQAEYGVLEGAEKNLTGYAEGARILLQAAQENRIEGVIGALGSNLLVPEEYETAIAVVLGEYIDSLIVETISHTDKALDLIEGESIRGSLFPLDVIRPTNPLILELEKAPVERGNILGIAANLISSSTELKPVIDLLMGQVIIVKDRKTARTLLSAGNWRNMPNLRIVTLKGEMFLASGPIITGASGKGILVRPRQRRETQQNLEQATTALEELENEIQLLEGRIKDLRLNETDYLENYERAQDKEKSITEIYNREELAAEKIRRNLQWHQEQRAKIQTGIEQDTHEVSELTSEIQVLDAESNKAKIELNNKLSALDVISIDELQTQHSHWNTRAAVAERTVTDAKSRQQDRIINLKQTEQTKGTLQQRISGLNRELNTLNEKKLSTLDEEKLVAGEIETIEKTIEPIELELRTLEGEHNNLVSTDAEARQSLRVAEQRYTQSKINLARHQESFESLRRRIEDDFGLVSFEYTESITGPKPLPLDGMVEELPKVETLSPEIEETIQRQRSQIRRMGAINPEAQAEYQEVKERYDFLTEQVDDLQKAEVDIKEVIAELDVLMEREFRRTFDAVAQEFRQIFTRLFGGGSARLALTDPDNMTETGIDIEARLPGRREQGLSLLSGGERSLTATALVFALLRVSPTPFCILDEVDAMLDEANVGRFRELLTELSENSQFIVITHNRNTVQAASVIYGVTMGRDSASQVISLKLDDLGEEYGV
jgi:chromosome segregation protein